MSDLNFDANFEDYVSFKANFGIVTSSGGSGLVDDVKVNGVSVVTDKVANVAVPTKVSSLENDAGYISQIPQIPNKLSQMTNDVGFTTTDYVDEEISKIPTPPTKTSQLTNDSGYITSADVPDPYDDTEIREEISGLDDKIKDLELFKFPNVTIIGIPTINNGQISDFSATSYLKFPFLVDFRSQPFEINMAFTTGSNVVQQENIFDSDYGLAFAIRNSRFVIAISTNGTSWDLGEGVGSLTVQPNTTYYIKIAWNGSQYVLYYSFDGVSFIPDITKAGTAQPYPKQIYIGVGENFASVVNHFGGTINLNNANLKVNGEIFWTGMDDAGISTRADVSLSNIDADGEAKIKEVAETDSIKASLNNKIEDSALDSLRNNITTLNSQMANKQDKLVSGTNIRTINGKSLLGSGDIPVGGSSEPVQLNIADHLSTTPARITNVADLSFDSDMNFSFTVKPATGYENLILSLGSLNVGSEYLLEYDVTLNSDPTFSGSYAYETYVSAGIPRPEANNSYDNLPKTRGETKHYSMAFFNEISGIPMYLCFFMPIISSVNTSYTVSNLKLSVKEYTGASESEIEQIKADLNELDDRVDVLEKMGKGILYDFVTQTVEGIQTVPKGGHMADIQKLLGNTIVSDNSLKSVNNTKVTIKGKNQWNERWEVGGIDGTTGGNLPNTDRFRSIDYIPVIDDTMYHMVFPNVMYICFYRKDKSFIERKAYATSPVTFRMPSDVGYIRFFVYGGENVYKNNISIIIGTEGDYSPYTETEIPLAFVGKSALTVRDEVDFVNKKYIQRIGSVDLGSLNWGITVATYNRFNTPVEVSNMKNGSNTAIISDRYTRTTVWEDLTNYDKMIYTLNKRIYISDSSYSSTDEFKRAMSGVNLYYELENPIVTDITDIIDSIKVEPNGSMVFDTEVPLTSTIEYLRYLNEV